MNAGISTKISIHSLSCSDLLEIFRYLSIPERWIASQVCNRWLWVHQNNLSSVNKTLYLTDRDWRILFSTMNEEEKQRIFQDILKQTGKLIERLLYQTDNLEYFPNGTTFESIITNCSNVTSILIYDRILLTELLHMATTCESVVTFNIDESIKDSDYALGLFFRNNQHLRKIKLNVEKMTGSCLLNLKRKPITDLVIKGRSERAARHLIELLKDLPLLENLSIDIIYREDLQDWLNVMGKNLQLRKIKLPTNCVCESMIRSLRRFAFLTSLNISTQVGVTDSILEQIEDDLPQLLVLKIAGCVMVTDIGLMAISKLPSLQKLDISGLGITGEGLIKFTTLRSLKCIGSTIFDKGLCKFLRNCHSLNSLDISDTPNLSIATIKTIIDIATEEGRSIRIFAKPEFFLATKHRAPLSLELICCEYKEVTDFMSEAYFVPLGVKNICHIERINSQITETSDQRDYVIPQLNVYCLFHILKVVPIPDQIRMERVSVDWKDMIQSTRKKNKKLYSRSPELALILFKKPKEEINNIMKSILERIGNYLEHIEIDLLHYFDFNLVIKNCPNLKSIEICSDSIKNEDIILLSACYRNLTELSLNYFSLTEESLKSLFHSNQTLKSLKLYDIDIPAEYLLELNNTVLERLYLSNTNWSFDRQLPDVLKTFKNLLHFVLHENASVSASLIESIGQCEKLQLLGLKFDESGVIPNLNPLLKLKNIEKLCFQNMDVISPNTFFSGLPSRCKSLSYIDFSDCLFITDDSLQSITKLPNLHTLLINSIDGINGSGLSTLSGSTFKRLECQFCSSITNDSLSNVLRNCYDLEFLNIFQCPQLDNSLMDVAIEVVSCRTKDVMLQLMANIELIGHRRTSGPPLLEFICME